MLYYLARPIARYVLRYYYRHIDITGLENIPTNGPVIFAANHPTAFIEPCILACFQERELHFLARGDLFKNRLATWALHRLHILPVFRLQDGGYGKLKENYQTFAACNRALSAGKAVMILAEGRCIHEKRLRQIRKGTGRIALSSLAADPNLSDIPIVPIGVNFTHPDKMRSTVMIRCGAPLSTRQYLADYQQTENIGVRKLTDDLRKALSPLVIQIPSREQDDLAEAIFTLSRSNYRMPLVHGLTYDGQLLDRELAQVQALPQNSQPILAYFNRLAQFDLTDASVAGVYDQALNRSVWGWCKTVLAAFLLLWHLPVWWLSELIGGTTHRLIEFYSPVRFAAIAIGMVVYPFLWLIGLQPLLIVYALGALVGVRWAWREWEATQQWYQARAAWRQIPSERQYLQTLRKNALDSLAIAE
ncbi:MAG: 1-acyl-sn-glycerol-3-phosphate acyltransferase [Bacteroidota bacterium]